MKQVQAFIDLDQFTWQGQKLVIDAGNETTRIKIENEVGMPFSFQLSTAGKLAQTTTDFNIAADAKLISNRILVEVNDDGIPTSVTMAFDGAKAFAATFEIKKSTALFFGPTAFA